VDLNVKLRATKIKGSTVHLLRVELRKHIGSIIEHLSGMGLPVGVKYVGTSMGRGRLGNIT